MSDNKLISLGRQADDLRREIDSGRYTDMKIGSMIQSLSTLERQIANEPAESISGLRVKAKVAKANVEDFDDTIDAVILRGLAHDVERIGG